MEDYQWEEYQRKKFLQGYLIAFFYLTFALITLFLCVVVYAAPEDIIIQTIAYESSGETYDGQVAVASVIKQRMIDRRKTADQVCLQKKQFSCWGANGKPTQKRKLSKKDLETARKAWNEAKPQGWNHYHAAKIRTIPSWSVGQKGKKIGNHIFYKL